MKWVMVAAALTLWCFSAHAAEVGSSMNLLENCSEIPKADANLFMGGTCLGFVTGVEQTRLFLKDHQYCLPAGVTNEQLIRIWLKYLNDTPSQLHLPAVLTYYPAMQKAFPCARPG